MRNLRIIYLLLTIMAFSSCKSFYPYLMFKQKKGDITKTMDASSPKDHILSIGDKITLQVLTNEGHQLINTLSQGATPGNQQNLLEYDIKNSGYVKLPVIDTVKIIGKTIREAETFLEEKYSTYYVDPFVILKVTNRNVYYILGEGNAKMIPLEDENPTLFEVITKAGGIQGNNKAYKIKLIRGDITDPQISQINLRTLDGIKNSPLYVQANDIIYIEPANKFTTGLSKAIQPYSTVVGILVSSLTLYYILFNR